MEVYFACMDGLDLFGVSGGVDNPRASNTGLHSLDGCANGGIASGGG